VIVDLASVRLSLQMRRERRRGSRCQRDVGVFLEIFSGSARLTTSLRRRGFGCIAIDLRGRLGVDVTLASVLRLIEGWISGGLIAGLLVATPCSSWSGARRGVAGTPGGPLRSPDHILGHPHALMRPVDAQKIAVGNKTMRASARILRCAIKHGLSCALENPAGSSLFRAAPIATIVSHENAHRHVLDFCRFGSKHRKRTIVWMWNSIVSESLDVLCHGRKGLCSETGRFHEVLEGSSKGVLRTAAAEAYPQPFASALAAALVKSAQRHFQGITV
jgi:hypothetical protein